MQLMAFGPSLTSSNSNFQYQSKTKSSIMNISMILNPSEEASHTEEKSNFIIEDTRHPLTPTTPPNTGLPPMKTSPPGSEPRTLCEAWLIGQRHNYISKRLALQNHGADDMELGTLDGKWATTLKEHQEIVDRVPEFQAEQLYLQRRISTSSSLFREDDLENHQHQLHVQQDEGYFSPSNASRSTATTPGMRELPRLQLMKIEGSFPVQQRNPKHEEDQANLKKLQKLYQAEVNFLRRHSSNSAISDQMDVDSKPVISVRQSLLQNHRPIPVTPHHTVTDYPDQLMRVDQQDRERRARISREVARSPRRHHHTHHPSSSPRRHYRHERRSNRSWNLQCITNSHSDAPPNQQTHAAASETKPKGPHSNKAYSLEEVDYIRYVKEDLKKSWHEALPLFRSKFPEIRGSDQCLSSRYYRDNTVPWLDEEGQPMYDDKGKLRLEEAKVRQRSTPEGKAKCIPYTLVDKHPSRAVTYDWVTEEHKEIARTILSGIDPTDPTGRKTKWRKIIEETDPERYRVIFEKELKRAEKLEEGDGEDEDGDKDEDEEYSEASLA